MKKILDGDGNIMTIVIGGGGDIKRKTLWRGPANSKS